jgi:hypothetical protein
VQAQRVGVKSSHTTPFSGARGVPASSIVAVAARCDRSSPTQAWQDVNGILTTTDTAGTVLFPL